MWRRRQQLLLRLRGGLEKNHVAEFDVVVLVVLWWCCEILHWSFGVFEVHFILYLIKKKKFTDFLEMEFAKPQKILNTVNKEDSSLCSVSPDHLCPVLSHSLSLLSSPMSSGSFFCLPLCVFLYASFIHSCPSFVSFPLRSEHQNYLFFLQWRYESFTSSLCVYHCFRCRLLFQFY